MKSGIRLVLLATLWLAIATHTFAAEPDARLQFDPGLRDVVTNAIAQAKTSLVVELFKLSDDGAIAALQAAARRGVAVRIILCPSQDCNQTAARKLACSGVAIRWYRQKQPEQIMHLKMAVIDSSLLIFGSANWTHWGLTLNHEGLLMIRDTSVIRQAETRFAADWQMTEEPAIRNR